MLNQVRDADIHLLRVFVAVAESGGFAAAQDRLNVAASTISTQISNLETRLGFRLCERGRAGFSLTNQGEIVLTSTYKLLRDLGEFVNTIEATQDDLVGSVRIYLIDNILSHPGCRFSTAMAQLRRQNPYLQLEVRQMAPGRIETALLKRETDLALGWFNALTPSLRYELLFQERHQIYCGADNPLFPRAPHDIDPAELEQADWVKRAYELPQTIHFAHPPVASAVSHYMEGIAHFILAGTHIGYLPDHMAAPWVARDLMRPIHPETYFYELPMNLATRQETSGERRVQAVRDAICAAHSLDAFQDSGKPIASTSRSQA
ncbi:LysR family transcriptional regulator [Paracoccus sp. Z330]|uniref:LysR family transcriptional regulator n=1 Tax=Paracoccus onchidii TaxID=3017813 RepID=A0ABT4ZD60_9RHOB|nr:LysR family transcriptional regulator [Paracoccus onchidii]MDB6177298.1 LysR family transcriptional regulator [Paracoccus onchidii]